MSEHKIDSKLLHSTVEGLCGNPNDLKGSPGRYNGEPGLPERTASKDAVPEKTYDTSDNLPKGKE